MQVFKINKNIDIVCNSENTRYGWRHLATLLYNGYERGKAKVCYYNRTWERYQYESVLKKLINDTTALTDKERKQALKKINK